MTSSSVILFPAVPAALYLLNTLEVLSQVVDKVIIPRFLLVLEKDFVHSDLVLGELAVAEFVSCGTPGAVCGPFALSQLGNVVIFPNARNMLKPEANSPLGALPF